MPRGYPGGVTSLNPFLYLQRNADENPRGVFSRSIDETLTNAEAIVVVKKLAYELRRLGVRAGQFVALDLPDQLSIVFSEALYHEGATGLVLPEGVTVGDRFDLPWVFSSRNPSPQGDAQVVNVDQRFLQQVEENPYGISPSEQPIETLRVAFTSGTTGTPHAVGFGRAMEQAMDAVLPTYFAAGPSLTLMDTGTAWGFGEFYLSVKGGHPYLCAGGALSPDVARLAASAGARMLKGSPLQIAGLVEALEASGTTLPDVHTVLVAGTVMPPGLAARTRAAMEGCAILSNYGSTEAGGATSRMYESDDPFDAGQVQPGTTLEIVDEHDAPVAAGQAGRIRYRSFGMVHEYLGEPEASARAFRDGWFYPGDLGVVRPDGGLTITGRESEVLNAGGVKIDPLALDHAALAHAGVRDACSFAYVDESGLHRIGLAVVSDDGADLAELATALRAEFTSAAPQYIARLEAIPRTATGKPKRAELAERFRRDEAVGGAQSV